MEPHGRGTIRIWRWGKQFVTPRSVPHFFLNNLLCVFSGFTHYDYPGIYQYQDFHHCGLEPGDNIMNYDNATKVWTCQLDGLAEYAFRLVLTPDVSVLIV